MVEFVAIYYCALYIVVIAMKLTVAVRKRNTIKLALNKSREILAEKATEDAMVLISLLSQGDDSDRILEETAKEVMATDELRAMAESAMRLDSTANTLSAVGTFTCFVLFIIALI